MCSVCGPATHEVAKPQATRACLKAQHPTHAGYACSVGRILESDNACLTEISTIHSNIYHIVGYKYPTYADYICNDDSQYKMPV